MKIQLRSVASGKLILEKEIPDLPLGTELLIYEKSFFVFFYETPDKIRIYNLVYPVRVQK